MKDLCFGENIDFLYISHELINTTNNVKIIGIIIKYWLGGFQRNGMFNVEKLNVEYYEKKSLEKLINDIFV